MIDAFQVIALAKDRTCIGIDGLPVSGKSSLAEQMERELGAVCLYLDDFVIPDTLWPRPLVPGYPFPYIRHTEFIVAATTLAKQRRCTIQPFDWHTGRLGTPRELIAEDRPVVIEGVSALDPALVPLYDLKVWVESDPATILRAALARGAGPWGEAWRNYFLPSVEAYMASEPRRRADHVMMGRGIGPNAPNARARPDA